MSHFTNIQEFLQHNQKLHVRIAEYYLLLQLHSQDERAKLLLGVLAKHETELAIFLRQYIDQAKDNILETFVQFDRGQSVESLFNPSLNIKLINCDEVQSIAHNFDQFLSELYQGMATESESLEVKALFESLKQHMEQEKKRLSKDINSNFDF